MSTPFGSRNLSVSARFELDSPKRLRLRFEQGSVSQPVFDTTASLSSILKLVRSGVLHSLQLFIKIYFVSVFCLSLPDTYGMFWCPVPGDKLRACAMLHF